MRILLFTGKGGVGKTTIATATALRLADRGRKTLLLSAATGGSLADALEVDLSDDPAEVSDGLWATQLRPQRGLERVWSDLQGRLPELLSDVGADRVTADELMLFPGVEEVLALRSLRERAECGDWDTLVVDCPATAETLRLLALPDALTWYVRTALRLQQRAGDAHPLAGLLAGSGSAWSHAVFGLMLPFSDALMEVRRLLEDAARTTVRLVLSPDAAGTADAKRAFTALSLYGYTVDEIVANRVFPADCNGWLSSRADAQQAQLAAVREWFGTLPVRELAYWPSEATGAAALREMGAALYTADDPAGAPPPQSVPRVSPQGGEYLLQLPVPFASASVMDVTRIDDELVLTVADQRRVLRLPSVLRRCDLLSGEVVGSGGRHAELRLRFRPDPDQWPDEWTGGRVR